jgi:hypothetical protein
MGPGIFIIAILGCSDADSACTQVRTLDARYESKAACTAATEAVLPAQSDVDYPVVVAQCVAADGTPPRLRTGEIKLPEGGTLDARTSPLERRS